MNPLISIIVPIYNQILYLDRCMKTILNQTYDNLEIILVDDGSTDGSSELCDQYCQKYGNIKVIHKTNGGISSARNAGIAEANGDYIGFVDSDDWISYDFYQSLYCLIKKYKADIASCSFQICNKFDYEDKQVYLSPVIDVFTGDDIKKHYLESAIMSGRKSNDISCCTKLYKSKFIKKLQFAENMTYEDVVFNAQLVQYVRVYVFDHQPRYFYFENKYSITRKPTLSDQAFDLIKGAEIIEYLYINESFELKRLTKQYMAKSHVSLALKMLRSSAPSELLRKEIKIVKKDFLLNMRSPMSVKKKVLLLLFQLIPQKLIILYKDRAYE